MNDPCMQSTEHWTHMWIYWILRKYGFPKDIVHQILKTYVHLYFISSYSNLFTFCPISKYNTPDSFKIAQKHYKEKQSDYKK